jgi:hypothetical protein
MRTILLPSGNLLVPVEPDDPADGFGLRELGPEHPEYGRYLGVRQARGDPMPRPKPREQPTACSTRLTVSVSLFRRW